MTHFAFLVDNNLYSKRLNCCAKFTSIRKSIMWKSKRKYIRQLCSFVQSCRVFCFPIFLSHSISLTCRRTLSTGAVLLRVQHMTDFCFFLFTYFEPTIALYQPSLINRYEYSVWQQQTSSFFSLPNLRILVFSSPFRISVFLHLFTATFIQFNADTFIRCASSEKCSDRYKTISIGRARKQFWDTSSHFSFPFKFRPISLIKPYMYYVQQDHGTQVSPNLMNKRINAQSHTHKHTKKKKSIR